VESDNANFESANDVGNIGDTLRPMEALDPDDVRNDDGDEVVDPPDHWYEADKTIDPREGESLDEKLSAEIPDRSPADIDDDDADDSNADPAQVVPDDQLDHLEPGRTGRDEGQIDGTPEDGDSLFPVVE
jgi:hypothetical protein